MLNNCNFSLWIYSTCCSSQPFLSLYISLSYFAGRTVISVPPTDQRVIKGTTAILDCNATHDHRVNIRYTFVSFSSLFFMDWLISLHTVHTAQSTCISLCCSFKWDRGGVPVLPTSGGRVSVRQGSLTIGQTWSGDIGDYTCTVTSQAGNDSRSARLEVMWVCRLKQMYRCFERVMWFLPAWSHSPQTPKTTSACLFLPRLNTQDFQCWFLCW